MVETLLRLDGEEITKSERLEAKTRLPELQKELEVLAEESIKKKELKKKEGHHDENEWSRENRWQSYLDQKAQKEADAKKSKENSMFKEYHEFQDSLKVSLHLYSTALETQTRCSQREGPSSHAEPRRLRLEIRRVCL